MSKPEEPWQITEQVLQWVDHNFRNSHIKEAETELLNGVAERNSEFSDFDLDTRLIYKIGIHLEPHPTPEGEIQDTLSVGLSFEFNGRYSEWIVAEGLDAEKTIQLLRLNHFAESLFQHAKTFLLTKLEITTPPHLSPQAKEYAEQRAALLKKDLKKQLEVKRPTRPSKSTPAQRREVLILYQDSMAKLANGPAQELPASLRNRLEKKSRGGLEPAKVVLRWAAGEQHLKYKPHYLEKVLTKARNENPDLTPKADPASNHPTLERA